MFQLTMQFIIHFIHYFLITYRLNIPYSQPKHVTKSNVFINKIVVLE